MMISARLNALMSDSFFYEPWENVCLEPFHGTREEWLVQLTDELRPVFAEKRFPIPDKVRTSIGWTKSKRAIGECWSTTASADNTTEIFIVPSKDDSFDIAQILVHELIHAAVGLTEGHKGNFKRLALELKLGGKMTATIRTPDFDKWIEPIMATVGNIPHARLGSDRSYSSAPAKQGTRMIKCRCETCGYTVRTCKKWITQMSPPHCPEHGEMIVEE